jgi:hypothetical protein
MDLNKQVFTARFKDLRGKQGKLWVLFLGITFTTCCIPFLDHQVNICVPVKGFLLPVASRTFK